MLRDAERRIEGVVPPTASVLDVGGWANPLSRADWVIDLLPWETRGLYGPAVDPARERFTGATWVRQDICESPWPFDDGQFDFAVCAQTLEDVRDPLAVCREIVRVARAGYVEVPSPVEELTWGLQGSWAGWSHHHWICEPESNGMRFTHKSHSVHAPGRHLDVGSCALLPPEDRVLQLWWTGSFSFREQIFVGADEFDPWLEELLATARNRVPRPALQQPTAMRGAARALRLHGRAAQRVRKIRRR